MADPTPKRNLVEPNLVDPNLDGRRFVEPGFVSQALRIAAKDLRIEWRSREVLATMTFLAVVVVLIFSFAFVVEGARPPAPVVAGILWVAVVVSGTVALSRAFDREREGEAIRSLLLAPAPRGAIYIGKLATRRLADEGLALAEPPVRGGLGEDEPVGVGVLILDLRRGRGCAEAKGAVAFGRERSHRRPAEIVDSAARHQEEGHAR